MSFRGDDAGADSLLPDEIEEGARGFGPEEVLLRVELIGPAGESSDFGR